MKDEQGKTKQNETDITHIHSNTHAYPKTVKKSIFNSYKLGDFKLIFFLRLVCKR